MTSLTVRRPPFRIDETVPFQWQPANPQFGLFGNAFTFIAIAFERYIVSATRQAMAQLDDPAVAAEADAFVRQEAQHARAHRAHARAMVARYPGLEATSRAAAAAYDELLEREDLAFHLAYIANLEATFTPLFKMMLDNRAGLFEGGDERVGTLFLWHFVEEIEHRSSALIVQQHVTPDRWYRVRQVLPTFRHVTRVYDLILDGFERHVPLRDRQIPTHAVSPNGLWLSELPRRLPGHRRRDRQPSLVGHVPDRDLRAMVWHLARSQVPGHDPTHEPLPAWAEDWHAAFDADADVTTYEGARL